MNVLWNLFVSMSYWGNNQAPFTLQIRNNKETFNKIVILSPDKIIRSIELFNSHSIRFLYYNGKKGQCCNKNRPRNDSVFSVLYWNDRYYINLHYRCVHLCEMDFMRFDFKAQLSDQSIKFHSKTFQQQCLWSFSAKPNVYEFSWMNIRSSFDLNKSIGYMLKPNLVGQLCFISVIPLGSCVWVKKMWQLIGLQPLLMQYALYCTHRQASVDDFTRRAYVESNSLIFFSFNIFPVILGD